MRIKVKDLVEPKVEIEYIEMDVGAREIELIGAYNGRVAIPTEQGRFVISQKYGGIEIARDDIRVWSSKEDDQDDEG